MNHSHIQSCMADYLEGDLSLAKRALFDAHLDACEDCSTELAEMRETIGLLRRLPTPVPPSDLTDNVMRRLAEGEGQPNGFDRMARWLGQLGGSLAVPRFAVPVAALAAGLAVVFVTGDRGFALPGFGTGTPVAAKVARAVHGSASRPSVKQARRTAATGVGSREEALAKNRSDRRGGRLGMRGSGLVSESLQARPGSIRPDAKTHSLALAHAEIFGRPQAQLIRTRDEWLEVLIEQPRRFAREHIELSSVEQDLWVTHLSRRAAELGRTEEVVAALRGTRDSVAVALADSFAELAYLRSP